jgi:hypothetical protein
MPRRRTPLSAVGAAVRIPGRFNGPPGSGNGGYSAGVFAQGRDREVTLRLPPPLDTPLELRDDRVFGPDGAVVAELAAGEPVEVTVPAVEPELAARVSASYAGFVEHPFPTCYVCGPQRSDGLCVFPGRTGATETAAPWLVPADVSAATVWAALDCPGGWAVIGAGRPYVLGRIAVRLHRLPAPGDACVVVGAVAGVQGRRALVHTTLYGPDGVELARARATWVELAR